MTLTSLGTHCFADTVVYQKYDNGMVIKKPNQSILKIISEHELHLSTYSAAYITDDRVKTLLDSGSVEVSREIIKGKGKYSNIVFTFTPMYKVHRLVITNSNNDVRSVFSEQIGDPVTSVWFVYGILSIGCMFLFQYFSKKDEALVLLASALVLSAALAALVLEVGLITAVVVALVAGGISVIVAARVKNKILYIFYLRLYYLLMGFFLGLCYFQI